MTIKKLRSRSSAVFTFYFSDLNLKQNARMRTIQIMAAASPKMPLLVMPSTA